MSFAHLEVEYYNLNRTRWFKLRLAKRVNVIELVFSHTPDKKNYINPDEPSELREAAELMAEHFNDLDGVESYFEILTALSGAI